MNHVLAAVLMLSHLCVSLEPFHGDDYIHPSVALATIPGKGQGLVVHAHVALGTVLLVEHPLLSAPDIPYGIDDMIRVIENATAKNPRIAWFIDRELASNDETEKQLQRTVGTRYSNQTLRQMAAAHTNDYFGNLYGYASKINHGKYPTVTFAYPEPVNSHAMAKQYPVKVVMAAKDLKPFDELLNDYGTIQFVTFGMYCRGDGRPLVQQRFMDAQREVLRQQRKLFEDTAKHCSVPYTANFLNDSEVANVVHIIDNILFDVRCDVFDVFCERDDNIPALHELMRRVVLREKPEHLPMLMDYFNVGSNRLHTFNLLSDNGIGKFYDAAIGKGLCEQWMVDIDAAFCKWVQNLHVGTLLMQRSLAQNDTETQIMLMSNAIKRMPLIAAWRLERSQKHMEMAQKHQRMAQKHLDAMREDIEAVEYSRFA
eukprot:167609_1